MGVPVRPVLSALDHLYGTEGVEMKTPVSEVYGTKVVASPKRQRKYFVLKRWSRDNL